MKVKFMVTDRGHLVLDGVLVSPCGTTVLECLHEMPDNTSIGELLHQYDNLFSYPAWYSHLAALKRQGLVKQTTVKAKRIPRGEARVLWSLVPWVREVMEEVMESED